MVMFYVMKRCMNYLHRTLPFTLHAWLKKKIHLRGEIIIWHSKVVMTAVEER